MRRCGEDCCLGGMSEGMRGRSQAVNHYSHLCALLVWSSPEGMMGSVYEIISPDNENKHIDCDCF